MSEHIGRVIVADQVVWEGTVPSGHAATAKVTKGDPITANTASGPVPTGRTYPDVTTVTFAAPAPHKPAVRKPAARKPSAKKSGAKKSTAKKGAK